MNVTQSDILLFLKNNIFKNQRDVANKLNISLGLVNKELVSDEWNGGYRGAGDFALNLPWEKGIIGLPHHGVRKIPSGTKITYGHVNENGVWENDNFKQQTPLKLIIKKELTSDEVKREIIRKAGYGVK